MNILTILLSATIGALIIYIWRAMVFFKNAGIPHKAPLPILGNMAPLLFRREHFAYYLGNLHLHWQHAKYFGFYEFLRPVIILRDTELIKLVTIKSFNNFTDHKTFGSSDSEEIMGKSLFNLKGQKWREIRNVVSPSFTASKMRMMSELMGACAQELTQFLINTSKNDASDIEIKDAFTKFTNDVIASCAFGISVNTMQHPDNSFYKMAKSVISFQGKRTLTLLIMRIAPTLSKWLKLKIFSKSETDFFTDIIKRTIETREREGITRPDMIQLLMESRGKNNINQLDITDITAQVFVFFVAGFDTTSALMSFVAVLLSINLDVQDKLLQEIDGAMEKCNGKPEYDEINSLSYLEAVLYETLRYIPIGGFLDRVCTETFELPPALPELKPFIVRPGMSIWVATHGVHYDPQHYENPTKFDPERFLDQRMSISMPTFLSFGIGPRACVGNRFALLETKMVLFHLLTKFKFAESSKLKQPIQLSKTSLAAVIEGGFWVKLIPR